MGRVAPNMKYRLLVQTSQSMLHPLNFDAFRILGSLIVSVSLTIEWGRMAFERGEIQGPTKRKRQKKEGEIPPPSPV